MDSKHYTEVLIDGRIYTLGGYEDEGYMQRVASYINEMITTLKRQNGFTKQSAEYQTVMVELNMADDYFKARDQIAKLEQLKHDMEKEVYSLKHELVTTQMKLDAAVRELEDVKRKQGRDKTDSDGGQAHGSSSAPDTDGRRDAGHGTGKRDNSRERNTRLGSAQTDGDTAASDGDMK